VIYKGRDLMTLIQDQICGIRGAGIAWTEADQHQLMGGTVTHSVGYMRAPALCPAEPELIGAWLLDAMAALVVGRGVPLARVTRCTGWWPSS
jgi:hypothetical protein